MKIEFSKKNELKKVIEDCYFKDNNGKLRPCNSHLYVSKDDPIYFMLKGLNNMTVRITNDDLIDGCSRFVVDEKESGINLVPCSIYCIIENDKYSFY